MASNNEEDKNNNLIIPTTTTSKGVGVGGVDMDDIYDDDDEISDEEERRQIELDNDVFEEDEEEEEDLNSVSSDPPAVAVTVAVPPPPPTSTTATPPPPIPSADRKPQPLDESARKLFQRLWTDEDEIELLRGFLQYSSQRGSSQHHHQDTAVFYDQIRSKLQLDFNKNQLVEKLRRLKKKYRTVVARTAAGKDFAFKSPHDQATYDISRRIWGLGGADDEEPNVSLSHHHHSNHGGNNEGGIDLNSASIDKKVQRSRKRSRVKVEENDKVASTPVSSIPAGLVEETVRSCLTPLFKELMNNAMNGPCGGAASGSRGGMLSPIPMNFGAGNLLGGELVDEKWRKQQILELEVYSKRLELVQDQIKATLEELRSAGS